MPAKASNSAAVRWRIPARLMALVLALVTIALYWPVTRCAFVDYDDPEYVSSNTQVQHGLSLEGIKWVFSSSVDANWHPLTMLSHMLDCQLFGLNPRGHHLTSVWLHTLNVLLVFALLCQVTGATWRSFFAAALFAVHPLRVESVAWIAERKDVLSGCLGLLSLICYVRYARKQPLGGVVASKAQIAPTLEPGTARLDYSLAVLFLALGLMSKAMLVTWPFVMLLLDYWPLGRLKPGSGWRLLKEKIPFFALSVVSSVVTFAVQERSSAVANWEDIPLGARIENALISYPRYLCKMFWPKDLAVLYPHPGYWPMGKVLLAAVFMGGISIWFWAKRRRCPFLLMGWLWYCGTLVPVIGLVQVGVQAMADRYTYLPSLGVLILAVWGAYELARQQRWRVMAWAAAGAADIVLCLGVTWRQLEYWRDNESLFRHAVEVTENNCIAHNNLGSALRTRGQIDEAIRQYKEAIRLKPDYIGAHHNLGIAFDSDGRIDEAIQEYRRAIRLNPDLADAHHFLGVDLGKKGRLDEAILQLQEAIRLKPDDAGAHDNLGIALFTKGDFDAAIRQYQEAIRLKPDDAEPHHDLGNALESQGQTDEAIRQYQEAIRLKPDFAEARGSLGAALGKKGRIHDALIQLKEAIRLKPDDAYARYNLGMALDQQGQIGEAIRQYQEAIRLKPGFTQAQNNLARALKLKNTPGNP